jgi:hypothetical protein
MAGASSTGDPPEPWPGALPGTPAWIEAQLQSRLGPDARLGALSFEGRLVHLRDASLPLGRDASLRIAHAVVELGAGLPLGNLPLSVRVVGLRCEVDVAFGGRTHTFPIELSATEGATEEAWVHGTLRLGGASGVASTIEVRPSGFRLESLSASPAPCRIRGWGRFPFAPSSAGEERLPLLALQIEGADGALLMGLGGATLARLPRDASLSGELSVSAARAVTGTFALSTPRSALRLHLALDEGRSLLGSTLRGHLAAADAATIGLSTGPVLPQPEDVVTVDTRLTGTLSRPGIAGRLAAEHLSLRIGRDDHEASPFVIEVDDASVLLDVGPDGVSWQRLAARLYGGRVTSSGRAFRASGALGATLAWSGVTLDALPARSPGEPAIGALLGGRAAGELRFERESRAEHALEARGHVTVSEPVYHFVGRVAPTLARYGLPAVSRRGAGPLVAEMRLARGEVVIEPAAATLDGIEVEGSLRVRAGGDLLGRVHVHLLEGYLARSRLLALPAALSGRVTIPVYVTGPPGALDVRTDALEILDGLLAGSRAGEAVKTVVGGLRDAARARWGRSPGGPRRR